MNSEEKPWRRGKQKEERNPNQFLERNDEDRRRRALVSLLFSSLPLPSPLSFLDLVTEKGGAGRDDRLRVQKGEGTVERTVARGYCSMGPPAQQLKTV